MKKYILFFLTTLLTINGIAQIAQGINFQAIARDNSNNIVTESTISIRLSIIQGNITGSTVYSETHQVVSDLNGVISLTIGQGSPSGDFNTIEWGIASHFLKTEMDITGGSNYLDMGTIQFASVPYAKYAETSGNSIELENRLNDMLHRIQFLEEFHIEPTTVTDIDGNVYPIVTIGTQVWMAENLRTTRYNDSTLIPSNRLQQEEFYNYSNEKLCPINWHVPTKEEFDELILTLGGANTAGAKLKSTGENDWTPINTGANEVAFNAIGTGVVSGTTIVSQGSLTFLMTSSTIKHPLYGTNMRISYSLNSNDEEIKLQQENVSTFISVRCIKSNTP